MCEFELIEPDQSFIKLILGEGGDLYLPHISVFNAVSFSPKNSLYPTCHIFDQPQTKIRKDHIPFSKPS